jgi:hypothetical protein
MLADSKPDEAGRLLALAEEDVHHRWQVYEELARRWPAAPVHGHQQHEESEATR